MKKRDMMILISVVLISVLVFTLMKRGYIVLDRLVFDFQVSHIIRDGEIDNIREYTVMHNYIEMLFERSPEAFNADPDIQKLNEMMVRFLQEK